MNIRYCFLLALSVMLSVVCGSTMAQTPGLASSGDLAAFQLKGKVKSVEWTGNWRMFECTLYFDEGGRLVKTSENAKIKHDGSGKLSSIVQQMEDDLGDMYDFTTTFILDGNGLLKSMKLSTTYEDWAQFLEYGKDGNQTRLEVKNEVLGGVLTQTYEYVSVDDKGNWTKRKFKEAFNGKIIDGPEEETRVITYYE